MPLCCSRKLPRSVQRLINGRKTRGQTFQGLKRILPTNNVDAAVLLYRSLRLADITKSKSKRATGKRGNFIRLMNLKLLDHTFSDSDHTIALDFLSQFARDASIQALTHARELIALPSSLPGVSRSQFETKVERVPSERGADSC